MLSIGTANKMFKLIKGIISRISNILNNKKKRVFNSDVKIFCGIPQAKKVIRRLSCQRSVRELLLLESVRLI